MNPGREGCQRCHSFFRLELSPPEVTAFFRLMLSTNLAKLCVVPSFETRVVVRASPLTFFHFDLSSSNADIDFVFLKLKYHIKTGHLEPSAATY
jgi:hypothetical protein